MSFDKLLDKKYTTTKSYQDRILIIGLVLSLCGLYGIPDIMIPESALMVREGTLRSANIYIVPVEDRKGHKSRKSELTFYLKEHEQVYSFSENIGSNYENEGYNKILWKLKQTDSIKVWIKNSELMNHQPEVFKIDGDKNLTILSSEDAKRNKRLFIVISLLFGLGFIKLFLWLRFPSKMKVLFDFKR